MESKIRIIGYDKLGCNGKDGRRYAWQYKNNKFLIESAAFDNKSKNISGDISGYTTSVSSGCILKLMGLECQFCRTGNKLPFVGNLSFYDIAKQNIVMVLLDMKDSERTGLSNNKREFAYMGQGEPGFNYTSLRLAIKLTNIVMKELNQKVHKHIVSTAGVLELIPALEEDILNNFFDSDISLHFSLHGLKQRDNIMPINSLYSSEEIIKRLRLFSQKTHSKICINVLLLNKFKSKKMKESYTTTLKDIEEMIKLTDTEHFRFNLSEYNDSVDIGVSSEFIPDLANEIYNFIKDKGYDVKKFFSFGKKEASACGLLGGNMPQIVANESIQEIEKEAEKYLDEAMKKINL